MTTLEARARLQLLAGDLAGLRDAEERAASVLAEARLALEAVTTECWADTGRGDRQAAADAYTQAERAHGQAARALEGNLRQAGLARALLRRDGGLNCEG